MLTAISITLTSLGLLAELTGVVLVVREIRSDQQRAKELFAPNQVPDPTPRSFGSPGSARSFDTTAGGTFSVSTSQILQSLDKLANSMAGAIVKSTETSVNYTDQERAAAQNETRGWVLQVRADLAEVLTGNVKSRQLGVVFLCSGLILSGAGSILSSI